MQNISLSPDKKIATTTAIHKNITNANLVNGKKSNGLFIRLLQGYINLVARGLGTSQIDWQRKI